MESKTGRHGRTRLDGVGLFDDGFDNFGQKCQSYMVKKGNIWLNKKCDGCYSSLEGGKDST